MPNLELLSNYYTYLKAKKAEGKKIIAYIAHDNIPEEIIDAAGFVPLNMIFAGNDELMNSSHDYLPPSTCSFAQSSIGLFTQRPAGFNFLELIDYFLVSNHCVSDICASEIITKYFSIPRLNFYIPYFLKENALKYYRLELLDLKRQLENIKGNEIKEEDLNESIKKFNNFKKKLLEVSNLEIKGKNKLYIFQEAMLYGPDFIFELNNIIQKYKILPTQTSNNLKDIIFTGCSIFINDYLIDLIEESGGNIVYFDTWIGDNYYSQILDDVILNSKENPLDLFVYRFQNNKSGDHIVPNYLENKVTKIETIFKKYKQKMGRKLGVINHIIKFCDHISINSAFLKEKLQKKKIPILNLERDYSRANRGQLSTRIEAFLEMI
ncbi:MAG: 2-hydroxyacyl-CoA dehydratase subunit D [Candidatus Thorarchaeota archaeon]